MFLVILFYFQFNFNIYNANFSVEVDYSSAGRLSDIKSYKNCLIIYDKLQFKSIDLYNFSLKKWYQYKEHGKGPTEIDIINSISCQNDSIFVYCNFNKVLKLNMKLEFLSEFILKEKIDYSHIFRYSDDYLKIKANYINSPAFNNSENQSFILTYLNKDHNFKINQASFLMMFKNANHLVQNNDYLFNLDDYFNVSIIDLKSMKILKTIQLAHFLDNNDLPTMQSFVDKKIIKNIYYPVSYFFSENLLLVLIAKLDKKSKLNKGISYYLYSSDFKTNTNLKEIKINNFENYSIRFLEYGQKNYIVLGYYNEEVFRLLFYSIF